jgi:2-methylisocitrate lyase-like PEP mutase family enzyme
MNQIQRGIRFQQLHTSNAIFLMPNAWDAGSALMLASLGFPALATTSAGISFSLGFPDQETAVNKETMLNRIESIATTTQQPVNADLQSGYGAEPEDVDHTIKSTILAGAVGANIEDYSGKSVHPLFQLEHAAMRIRAARRAADATGIPFVLTARTDVYLSNADNPLTEAINRCNAYREAGADCLFVPGVSDLKTIATLVKEINGPISVVMGLTDSRLTVSQLESIGVRRVTIGGSLARATYSLIRKAAVEMAQFGTFSYATEQIADSELSHFFATQRQH